MTWYIGKRLAMIVPVLLGVSILVFSMMHLVPGDVATALAGPAASEAVKEVIRHTLGLDQPVPVQFWNWIANIGVGDFGISLVYKRPISEFVFQKFLNTGPARWDKCASGHRRRDVCWYLCLRQGPLPGRQDYHGGHVGAR